MLNRNHTGAKVGMKVNLSRMRKVISFVIVSLLMFSILLPGCKKKEDEIDLVGVNIDVSLTDPSFVDLNAVGGWVYISGGVRGIIIYRKSLDEFVSYETVVEGKLKEDPQHQSPYPVIAVSRINLVF